MKSYDFLVVGSGLYGAVFANEMHKSGKSCLVIDRRKHSGGNVYCENHNGINVHSYGAHIFHTNDEFLWKYVNDIVPFNNYVNSPLAIFEDKLYNLPFNMNTFYQLWGVHKPEDALAIIKKQSFLYQTKSPRNLEEQALSMVGDDIYRKLIKGYTEKQWGRPATELPSFIIKRIPLRFTFNNNYFNDRFQGIPLGGYNHLINGLLRNTEVKLNTDYFKNRVELNSLARTIVFTGKIDEYFDFIYGELEYRSLSFEHETLEIENFQGNAVINYTDKDVPFTRIIEHKHFEPGSQNHTVITREYPQKYHKNNEAFYPVNDDKNNKLYKRYLTLAKRQNNVIFGGRLAEFKYYDMHQVIASSIKKARDILKISEHL